MREVTLGIVGGCLSHQPGVPPSALYHRRLTRRLAEAHRVRLRVRIAREGLEHADRLAALLEQHPLDAVLVHARVPYYHKAALFATVAADDELRYYLHPFLLRPWRSGWAAVERSGFAGRRCVLRRKNPLKRTAVAEGAAEGAARPEKQGGAARGKRILGVSVRDLLYAGGALARLDAWAIRDELRMLGDVRALCERRSLPLFVLGPSRRPREFWIDRLARKLDARLRRVLCTWCVPYCSLVATHDREGRALYAPDGWHYTAEAHGYVAEQVAAAIEPWVEGKAA